MKKDTIETHNITHNGLLIEVKILKRGGIYISLSFDVFRGNQNINHRLSDAWNNKIEKIISEYTYEMNRNLH